MHARTPPHQPTSSPLLLQPKISKLGNFFRDHAVKAGSIVTGTCDPTIPSVTLAAKQAAGAGGGVVAAPAAQLGVAPLPPLPLQQQQQKRPLSAKWQRGHAQKPSLVAPERHTAPASRPGTEFVSLLSDEEEGPQQQQPQQQQQQQAGATVRAAASAAAGAPACAEAGPGPALHQLSLAGSKRGEKRSGPGSCIEPMPRPLLQQADQRRWHSMQCCGRRGRRGQALI